MEDSTKGIGSSTEPLVGVAARWPGRLGTGFVPISSAFLRLYHRLRPHENARGLTSTEAMLVIHLLDHKWTHEAPFPTVGLLAERLGCTPRAVRQSLANLEQLGLIRRQPSKYGPNRYFFDGLYAKLEVLLTAEQAEKAAA